MTTEAATPTGAEAESRQGSITDRLRASIFTSDEPAKAPPEADSRPIQRSQEAPEAEPEQGDDDAQAEASEPQEEAEDQAEEQKYETISELAEALGWDMDKLLDMDAPTKVDGKESRTKLRDLVKSYQLEQHLNGKLQTHANEVKAFQEQATRQAQELTQRLQYMQHAQTLAEQLLHAEFANTNWDQLRADDPATYNAKVVEFQDRQRKIQQLASQLGTERQRTAQQAEAEQASYFAEQRRLLEAKLPEWADSAKQAKELADMIPAAAEAYGLTEDEIRGTVDHRHLLVLRDAWQWRKLQSSKPALLNKVKNAPKLLKPGTQQSRAASQVLALKQDQEKLRKTGKVRDAAPALKRLLFNQ